jgi:antitoxin component YwqK of YwqJK toxin-antitoxin module
VKSLQASTEVFMLENKEYVNGQKTYEFVGNKLTYFYKNGNIKAEGIFENDLMQGEWRFYRETGQLWQVGNFINGMKNGPWVRYDKTGKLEYSETFIENKIVKKKR